jgi:hypothetical protein
MNVNFNPPTNKDNTVATVSTYIEETNFNGFDTTLSSFPMPLEDEIDIYKLDGTYAFPIREFHTMCPHTSNIFNGRYCTISSSYSGRFVMWTSPWENTLGSGINTNNCNTTGSNVWQPGHMYTVGQILTPIYNNYENQLDHGSNAFIVISSGISGTSPPLWNSIPQPSTTGTITDGGGTLVWQANNTNNCRVDVFLGFLGR